jgi:hypothetical protein
MRLALGVGAALGCLALALSVIMFLLAGRGHDKIPVTDSERGLPGRPASRPGDTAQGMPHDDVSHSRSGDSTLMSLSNLELNSRLPDGLRDFRQGVLEDMPGRCLQLKGLMTVSPKGFGDSEDAVAQKLLSDRNASLLTFVRIHARGQWKADMGQSGPVSFTIDRESSRSSLDCGWGPVVIANEMVTYTDKWGHDLLEWSYMLPFAVFDPKAFRFVGKKVIRPELQNDGVTTELRVSVLESPRKRMYFDEGGTLRRIELMQARGAPYCRIDLGQHLSVGGARLPQMLNVVFLKPEHYSNPREIPKFLEVTFEKGDLEKLARQSAD